jgi:hypothetical protein
VLFSDVISEGKGRRGGSKPRRQSTTGLCTCRTTETDGGRVWAKCAYSHSYTDRDPYSDTNSHSDVDTDRYANCYTNICTEAKASGLHGIAQRRGVDRNLRSSL